MSRVGIVLAGVVAVGCRPDDEPAYTYHRDIQPLVEQSCVGCHYEGGIGPFALESYDDLYEVRVLAEAAVASGAMPPWKPADDCNSFENDWSLTDEEKAMFSAWVDQGAVEGPVVEEDVTDTEEPGLDRVDVTLEMTEPFTPMTAPDEYRCFLLPWPLEDGKFVTGIGVEPGNTTIVHHVIAFTIAPDEIGGYQKMDEADATAGYPCYGGPGGDELATTLLGGWAPGGQSGDLPNGTGIYVEPGTWISLQVHYNLTEEEAGQISDVSKIQFKVDDVVDTPAEIYFIADPLWVLAKTMDIPAGEKAVTHEIDFTLGSDFTIHTSNLHMHMLGERARYAIERADGTEDCLLAIDDWDFHWQLSYVFDEPKQFRAGDTLHLECTFDNSAENQPEIDGVQGDPQDVNWGEGTGDEMCLATMLVSD